ncbi:MAG TPA: transcriptional initiation protein Tat, partial [bacterium]|nr:transcriptional initiation protein Tat [bacterium]
MLFLRGGADGLALVPPVGDDGYHRARPRIAVAAHDAIHLDDRFGLNPRLAAFEWLYREGQL